VLTPGALFERRYEIVELLARGGMGAVYRARRTVLGDDVAIKVLTAPQDAALRERFLRESRAAAQLRHPYIVSILDYDVDVQGHPYLVMEYLNGPSLMQRLAVDRRLPLDEVLRIVPRLCSAFQVAHAAGVIHRDIKPGNVVGHEYASGEFVYKVVDFGLAHMRQSAGDVRLTVAREFLGTVVYASPEQLRGEPTDARSDLYSFGAMVYELLSGHPPFEHDEPLVIVTRHLTKEPRPLREVLDNVPAHVDETLLRALAKDPAARFASMEAFAQALAEPASPPIHVAPPASGMRSPAELPEVHGHVIDRLLGPGRLGSQVYLGHHATMRTPVAVRVLRRAGVADWEAVRERFLREARAMQVVHPSVLQVRDVGETPDSLYVVTDYIEGESLAQRLDVEGPLPWGDLQRFTAQLVDAVTVLHRRGSWICGVSPYTTRLLHDVDGDRLLVSSGGIGQVRDLLGTMSGAAMRGDEIRQSELPYVAPEVLMGDHPSALSDLFTVGALVYHMATGTAPFDEASLPELMGAMLRKRPEALAVLRPEIPQAFSDAIMRTLSPVPTERPADARALGMAL
jgi:serine/threonine protein kinase